MLSCMQSLLNKNLLLFHLLIYAVLSAGVANGGIFKGTDDKGNVYYSDQPIEDSEKFTPQSISVVGSSKGAAKTTAKAQSKEGEVESYKYAKFDIVDPLQNQVIRNQQNVSVSLQIEPPLNVKQNHKIWLLMDGKPIVKDSQVMALKVGKLNRGAHKFQAQVKDGNGKVVARTRTVVAHIKQGAY